MMFSARFKTAQFWSVLDYVVNGSVVPVLISDVGMSGAQHPWSPMEKWNRDLTVAEVDEEESVEPPTECEQQHDTSHTTTSWSVFCWNCAVRDGNDIHADGGSLAVWLAL